MTKFEKHIAGVYERAWRENKEGRNDSYNFKKIKEIINNYISHQEPRFLTM